MQLMQVQKQMRDAQDCFFDNFLSTFGVFTTKPGWNNSPMQISSLRRAILHVKLSVYHLQLSLAVIITLQLGWQLFKRLKMYFGQNSKMPKQTYLKEGGIISFFRSTSSRFRGSDMYNLSQVYEPLAMCILFVVIVTQLKITNYTT